MGCVNSRKSGGLMPEELGELPSEDNLEDLQEDKIDCLKNKSLCHRSIVEETKMRHGNSISARSSISSEETVELYPTSVPRQGAMLAMGDANARSTYLGKSLSRSNQNEETEFEQEEEDEVEVLNCNYDHSKQADIEDLISKKEEVSSNNAVERDRKHALARISSHSLSIFPSMVIRPTKYEPHHGFLLDPALDNNGSGSTLLKSRRASDLSPRAVSNIFEEIIHQQEKGVVEVHSNMSESLKLKDFLESLDKLEQRLASSEVLDVPLYDRYDSDFLSSR